VSELRSSCQRSTAEVPIKPILELYIFLIYIEAMTRKTAVLLIRLMPAEKVAFVEAASLAGIPLSSWIRERLRLAAIRELEGAGRAVPFVAHIPLGKSQ
jgi:hypothetical protein